MVSSRLPPGRSGRSGPCCRLLWLILSGWLLRLSLLRRLGLLRRLRRLLRFHLLSRGSDRSAETGGHRLSWRTKNPREA